MTKLDHEQLDVYHDAVRYLVVADAIAAGLDSSRRYLCDQLRRAASSIVLNTAEGAGEFSAGEKARFYRMARRSATECAAIMDACRALRLSDAATLDQGRDAVVSIVSQLVGMIRAQQTRGAG